MKRDLIFVGHGPMSVALGVTPERIDELDRQVNQIIDEGGSLQDVVDGHERARRHDGRRVDGLHVLARLHGRLQPGVAGEPASACRLPSSRCPGPAKMMTRETRLTVISTYAIYERPRDYPRHFVVRRWDASSPECPRSCRSWTRDSRDSGGRAPCCRRGWPASAPTRWTQ